MDNTTATIMMTKTTAFNFCLNVSFFWEWVLFIMPGLLKVNLELLEHSFYTLDAVPLPVNASFNVIIYSLE